VQLGQQRGSAVVQAGQVDQQRLGLPLLGGEAGSVGQRDDLRRKRLLEVELAGNVNDAGDGLAGKARDLGELVGGEGVGEVEEEHLLAAPKRLGNLFSQLFLIFLAQRPTIIVEARQFDNLGARYFVNFLVVLIRTAAHSDEFVGVGA